MPFRAIVLSCIVALAASPLLSADSASQTIRLAVDLTDAPRSIFHARLVLPVHSGPLTLVYPKWIPGNHRPSGPIANLVGLKFEADGKPVGWERDPLDMYAFHVAVPAGATNLQATYDAITNEGSAGASGPAATSNLLDLNWNFVVLYPQGANADSLTLVASINLPSGWKYATALHGETVQQGDFQTVRFEPVSLTRLIDSPVIAGSHFREIELGDKGEHPAHFVDMVAESQPALEMDAITKIGLEKLVAETGALFGARHYRDYRFLLTLSDEAGHHGVEHHESSDNSVGERMLIEPDSKILEAGLMPHEFTHSWNGKYRRPAGLATPNYQEPMAGDLLWVYEGLTEYLGNIMTARSGLWTPEQYREALAETAATLDHRAGRSWRPLEDTARSVQILRLQSPQWESWRRSLDYYPEGELLWLDVDITIRRETHGQRSLNDFCRIFHGGQSGAPMVTPYNFEDVIGVLNQVAPYDWAKFLHDRVDAVTPHAPLGGIENGGWKLVYNETPNEFIRLEDKLHKALNLSFSLGLTVDKDGGFVDVMSGSPAYQSGLGPGMKLIAVNSREWSNDVINDALRVAQRDSKPIELLVENAKFFKTYRIDYHDGIRYPHLVRAMGDDLMGEVIKPLSK